jgi:hypothetical protein
MAMRASAGDVINDPNTLRSYGGAVEVSQVVGEAGLTVNVF